MATPPTSANYGSPVASRAGSQPGTGAPTFIELVETSFSGVNSEMFPVSLEPVDLAAQVGVEAEAVMGATEVRQCWTKMFERWGVTDDNVKKLLIVAVMRYFIINGSSPRCPFERHLQVAGKRYPVRVVGDVLRRNVRRFCRAQADLARSVMRADEAWASEVGARFGMFEYYDLAFDFADYCSGLKEQESDRVAMMKRRILQNTTPYKGFVDTTTPVSQVAPELGNSSSTHQ